MKMPTSFNEGDRQAVLFRDILGLDDGVGLRFVPAELRYLDMMMSA